MSVETTQVGEQITPQQTTEQLAQQIYDRVIALQKREFGRTWPRDKEEMIMKYVMYLHVETDELLQEINFKAHKAKHPINMENVRKEIADLLIYVFAVSGVAFDSLDDFLQCVKEKQDYNEIRPDWNTK